MLRDGRIDSVGLVDLLLRRIARLDLRVRAFRVVLADQARRGRARGGCGARRQGDTRPLLGVPIALKDNVAVRGPARAARQRLPGAGRRRRTPSWSAGCEQPG